jgi:hypothetical protein
MRRTFAVAVALVVAGLVLVDRARYSRDVSRATGVPKTFCQSKRGNLMRSLGPLVLALLLAASAAEAATITGTVTGPDGAPFRGAFVQARHAGLKMTVSVLADNDGRYVVETPEQTVLHADRSAQLRRCIAQISPEHREVIRIGFLHSC